MTSIGLCPADTGMAFDGKLIIGVTLSVVADIVRSHGHPRRRQGPATFRCRAGLLAGLQAGGAAGGARHTAAWP
jgi:hypothetical protein